MSQNGSAVDTKTATASSQAQFTLTQGSYQVSGSNVSGWNTPAAKTVTVNAGGTSSTTLEYTKQGTTPTGSPVGYIDANGNIQVIEPADLTADNFVFYAWLENEGGGIIIANLTNNSDPGQPSQAETEEFAPSRVQNLGAAWVGFKAADGNVYPVAGAKVRWELDRQYTAPTGVSNSVMFGAADDGSNASGFSPMDINDDQADTATNYVGGDNAPFPIASDFPLYNQTGVGTPNTDGFSWVTLFSPDARAKARLVVVATVNGAEVGKEILIKDFVPAPVIEIEKTVNPSQINLNDRNRTTFTITVRNVGEGTANNVELNDFLSSGNAATYSIDATTLPVGATPQGDDGFTYTVFDLGPDQAQSFTFDAVVTGSDTYCNFVEVTEIVSEFRTLNPDNINDEACFTAVEPELGVIKDFVNAAGESLGQRVTALRDEVVNLRIRVPNNGTGDAVNVVLTDELISGNALAYAITEFPTGATPVGDDGFTMDLGTIPAGNTETVLFKVKANQDGEYCDSASINTGEQDQACLVIAEPNLNITKNNDRTTVRPGRSYNSTIVVSNSGSAAATNVLLADRLGKYTFDGVDYYVQYESSNQASTSGTYDPATETVTAPNAVTLQPGQSVTFTVTSSVPAGSPSGEYCDIGSFTSGNAGSGEATDCITVPAFAAIQTQMVDGASGGSDPYTVGENVGYSSILANEERSNEALGGHIFNFDFGQPVVGTAPDGSSVLGPPEFPIITRSVYYDPSPVFDPVTGTITSDRSSPSAQLLTQGPGPGQYTVTAQGTGEEQIVINRQLPPNSAFYFFHEVNAPRADVYESDYTYTGTGVDSSVTYPGKNSETTTVLAP